MQPYDDVERWREAWLALCLGEVRSRALAMPEVHPLYIEGFREEFSALCSMWAEALRAVEFRKKLWPVYDVFGGLEDEVAHWCMPVRFGGNSVEAWRIAEEERRENWNEVREAAVEGGVDSMLAAFWKGVPLEDILAKEEEEVVSL